MYLTKGIDKVFLSRPRSSCRRPQIFIKKSRWMLLMLLTKLTRYVITQSGSARITVASLVHMYQIAAYGLMLRLFVKIVSLSFRSFLSL